VSSESDKEDQPKSQSFLDQIIMSERANNQVPPTPASKKEKVKETPFDFSCIKVLIKKSNDKESKEVLLNRDWVTRHDAVPHFAGVIKNVDKMEGVEITMNCNASAFEWLMAVVRIRTDCLDLIE
jgi:hypothetical protein